MSVTPKTSPETIFRLRDGSFADDLFITAVAHLDFFNQLAETSLDLSGICKLFDIRPRPADVMLSLFKSYGFVEETGFRFSLTDTARTYLTKESRYDLTSYVDSLKARPICADMLRVLRTGETANWAAARSGEAWAKAMEDEEFAASFTAGMNSRGAYLAAGLAGAFDFSDSRRLLDIGGATGIYAQVVLEDNPHMTAGVFEKPPIDQLARQSAEKSGLTDRLKVIAGDMFRDELPGGYDVHLLSHILHDWDVPQVTVILQNSYRNLAPGGRLIIHDAHLNEARNGPVSVAEYSVLLMFSSEGKCYSTGELRKLLSETGFADFHYSPTILNRSIVTATK